MTSKETSKWMKEKGYEEMWILPEMDIFASDTDLKLYRGHTPGNSPEIFNLDSCMNKYFHKAVDCHVRYKDSLHKLDPKKFNIATPKKETSAHLRIFDPIESVDTSNERIISKKYDVLTSINHIVEAEGCIILDVNNVKNMRKGRQREFWGSKDIMEERECVCWLRMTTVQFWKKISQGCTWSKGNIN